MSTATMVLILVLVVKGVFICFALMAVCYRSVGLSHQSEINNNTQKKAKPNKTDPRTGQR